MNHQWYNTNKTPVSRIAINRYSTRQRYHGSSRNGHSVRLQNLYCVSNTRQWLQALTTPLARLPEIARNGRRATAFVGWNCPQNLYYENSGNKRFPASNSCSLHILCALNFEGRSAKWMSLSFESTFVRSRNDLISTVFSLIIWSVKYWTLIWIINDTIQIKLQYLE